MKKTSKLGFLLTTFSLLILLAIPSWAAVSVVPPRLGGGCSIEFKWARIPSTDRLGYKDLICLPDIKGLHWRDSNTLQIDAYLDSKLMKCGRQLRPIVVAKTDPTLLSSFRKSVADYISTRLHMQFVQLETTKGFFNLNVIYYREQGICSNGVGTAYSGTGPDKRIPANAKLLWEAEVILLKGHDKHEVSFALARVGNSWKFVGAFEFSYVFT